jgi:Fic family protein
MKKYEIGILRNQPGGYKAFVPNSFPPDGGFEFTSALLMKNNEATRLLGKLDGITKLLPDLDFFLLMYLRKDAAASSQIEGTMATMVDSIEAEVSKSSKIPTDVDDILHYIKALDYGLKRVEQELFPVSLRFIRELHHELMLGARTTHFPDPGEFRKSQNWIGGTRPDNARYVPPPVDDMNTALSSLEAFIHANDQVPIVIKTGIIHAQFELIHPFLDGNGRTGRMLITFYLWKAGYLEKPVLFLSSFFKKYQKLYYEKLEEYHNGNVYVWVDFFLDGVIEIAEKAIITVEKITILRQKDFEKIQRLNKKASESACLVLPKLYHQPIINMAMIQKWTGFTRRSAIALIDRFIDMGILTPKDVNETYNQKYIYQEYLSIFTENE